MLAAKDRDIQERDHQIEDLREEVGVLSLQLHQLQDTKVEELHQKDKELQRKDEVIQRKDEVIQQKDEVIQRKDEVIQRKDEVIQRNDEVIQQNDEVIQRKDEVIREKNTQLELLSQELHQKSQELDQKDRELQEKDCQLQQLVSQAPYMQATPTSFTFGLETATVKTCSQFSVEILYSGRPCSSSQHVTAELNSITTRSVTKATVVQKSSSTYEVTYTPTTRGRHELCVKVNNDQIQGSPSKVVVYPDPTQLHQPVRMIKGVKFPYGVAFNSHGKMYVTESSRGNGQIAVLDSSGKRICTIGSQGDRPGQFQWPCCIAIDSSDNVYVTSQHKLQKFDRNGKFVKSVGSGRVGSRPGEFRLPRGVKVHQNQVYVCDFGNDRIQVFDLELFFITSFGTKGSGEGQYDRPNELAFDREGNIYVGELGNKRVQVLDPNGHYLRHFGHESGPGKLDELAGIHIAHNCVYVSDYRNHCIVVFQLSGAFLTSFGKEGKGRGQFDFPCGVVFDCNGFLYVCDWINNRIQVF